MRWTIPILLAALPAWSPAGADVTGPGGRTIDCYCTDTQGARVEMGETICLVVDGRAFLALCDMSVNVPIWRDTGKTCLGADLQMTPIPGSESAERVAWAVPWAFGRAPG